MWKKVNDLPHSVSRIYVECAALVIYERQGFTDHAVNSTADQRFLPILGLFFYYVICCLSLCIQVTNIGEEICLMNSNNFDQNVI